MIILENHLIGIEAELPEYYSKMLKIVLEC